MTADPSRPFAFLVTTPGGSPAAADVLAALAPALERLGSWRLVPHPESSLVHAASSAERDGRSAVHLAIGELNACYLTPAVRTVSLPLWDYPDLPAYDLCRNGRLNTARIASRVDLFLAPSRFTADAFQNAGVKAPIAFVPIPARPGWSDVPTWGPDLPVTVRVPHVCWGGRSSDETESEADLVEPRASLAPIVAIPMSPRQRALRAGKRRLRRIKPYLSNATVQKLDGYKQKYGSILLRPNPARLLGQTARAGYRHLLRRWISDEAHRRLKGLKDRLRGRRSHVPHMTPDRLAASPLTLSGLVYSAAIDYSDPATNDRDLLSATLHAFRDRDDVTLLIRLTGSPEREANDLACLRHAYDEQRVKHRCRVVVVTGLLALADSLALARSASYHIETARSRGAALALMDALTAGRPVIAPRHSAFADWVDDEVGLTVLSHPEPTAWPSDPLARHATTWHRPVWADLRDRLRESAAIADHAPARYEALSAAARRRMADRAGIEAVAGLLRQALDRLPARAHGALSWA